MESVVRGAQKCSQGLVRELRLVLQVGGVSAQRGKEVVAETEAGQPRQHVYSWASVASLGQTPLQAAGPWLVCRCRAASFLCVLGADVYSLNGSFHLGC